MTTRRIAAITVAELRVGVLVSDGKRREARQAFVEDVIASLPVLEYDLDVAEVHADLLTSVRIRGEPWGRTISSSPRSLVPPVGSSSLRDISAFENLPGVQTRHHR